MGPITLTLLHTTHGGFTEWCGLAMVLLALGFGLAGMDWLDLRGVAVVVAVVAIYVGLFYGGEGRYYARSDGRMEVQRLRLGRRSTELSPLRTWKCSLWDRPVNCGYYDDDDCDTEYTALVSSPGRVGFTGTSSRNDPRPAVAYCERMAALGMHLERATLGPPSPARRRAPTNAPTGDVPRP